MKKSELVEALAVKSELSKAKAGEILDSLIDIIVTGVTKGTPIQITGFGSFSSGKRAARVGRNPATGEKIKIAASKTVKFSAGKTFKDAVNKKKKK